jgi:hypothetical protein
LWRVRGARTLVTTFFGEIRVRWTLLICAVLLPLQSVAAQVVRGVVTERVSGQPLRGVLVTVASASDSGIRHTLTNVRGEYVLRLSSAGQYVVSAKAIGVARFTTDVITVRDGETRRIDVQLDAFEHKLPVVNVLETDLCLRRSEQKRQIVALWDEVRTALFATSVSRDEQLLTGWLSKHVRTLEPRSLRILDDRHTVAEGLFERPMRSISGDSLAQVGFWHKLDEDTLIFHAPDEEALLSRPFRAAHCFELVAGRDAIRGMIGLAFKPRRITRIAGIEGTIWIDAGNFELRFVEFRYTNLLTVPSNPHLGGQVHYLRHPSGAWLVRRWHIRMPVFPEITPVANLRTGGARDAPRATVWRVIEEGGGLYTPGLSTWETPGTISGTIMDSTGLKPLVGTLISLSGTPLSAESDSLGRFRFDSIPPGAYTLLASHPVYAGLGQMADDEPLTLEQGQVYQANMRAASTSTLLELLCPGKTIEPGLATLRVLATFGDSGPASRLPLWLRWADPSQKVSIDPINPRGFMPTSDNKEGEERFLGIGSGTDADGAAVFCGVPAYRRLELYMVLPNDDPTVPRGSRVSRLTGFYLMPNEVVSRTVKVSPPEKS